MVGWMVAAAHANPGMVPYPPQVSEKGVGAWGAGLGYGEGYQVSPGFGFSGWSRYGISNRVEAFGGAWLTVPVRVGVHGGLRASVGNRGGADGWGGSAGISVGAGELFNVAVPLEVGLQRRTVRAWVGAQPAIFPLVTEDPNGGETLSVPLAELTGLAGVEVDVDGFAVSLTGGGGSLGTFYAVLGVTYAM
jgi:hypothetical protein